VTKERELLKKRKNYVFFEFKKVSTSISEAVPGAIFPFSTPSSIFFILLANKGSLRNLSQKKTA